MISHAGSCSYCIVVALIVQLFEGPWTSQVASRWGCRSPIWGSSGCRPVHNLLTTSLGPDVRQQCVELRVYKCSGFRVLGFRVLALRLGGFLLT